MPELKPCPNCGSTAHTNVSDLSVKVFAECQNINCWMSGPIGFSEAEAIQSWNAIPRHPDPQPIETAPKDTWILVGRLGLSNWVASYYSRDGFTHWLPMPPLPEDGGA